MWGRCLFIIVNDFFFKVSFFPFVVGAIIVTHILDQIHSPPRENERMVQFIQLINYTKLQ
jgi:hypothetical protein